MSRFLSAKFDGMAPYVPGEQPQGREYVKLNTNECPYPPSPRVLAALTQAEVARLNLYPDPEAADAAGAIASLYAGLGRENVLIGNGSDEILAFCFHAFCDAHSPAVFPDVTYGFYPVFAQMFQVPTRVVPLMPNLRVAPESLYNAGGTVFLANPNAPTGYALSFADVEAIVRENREHVVVVDEAYVDFGAQSCVPLIPKYDNLVVVMTMSKSRNLAGARVGYALSNPALIADLRQLKFSFNPYNANRLSLLAAKAAAEDTKYFRECVYRICAQREHTRKELTRRGFTVLPGVANFLFASPPGGDGKGYYEALKERGVLVRHFGAERTKNYVRITIGTATQMETLLDATYDLYPTDNAGGTGNAAGGIKGGGNHG